MFRRKRSSSRHQPLSATSSQNAQSAASHAFLNAQPSSGNLSSAAAATAMRALSPAPSPVGEIQTKRMVKRRASLSQADVPSLSSQASLRRANSSSSMTSRIFREQSPRRPATTAGPVNVPPLPAIPPQFAPRRGMGRRSLSVDTPIRPISTPPKSPSDRGSSVDTVMGPGPGHSANRVHGLSTVPEVERSASRSSVNFSRPMNSGAKPPSPPWAPIAGRDVSTPPPRTRGLGSAEPAGIQRSVSQSGTKPIKTRSKGFSSGQGGHLSTTPGGAGYPVGTAVAAAQAASLPKDEVTLNHSQPETVRPSDVHGQAAAHASMQMNHQYPPGKAVATTRELDEGEERAQVDRSTENIDQRPVSGRVLNDSSAKLMEQTKAIHNLPCEEPPAVTVAPMPTESPLRQNILTKNHLSPESEPESGPQYWRPSAGSPRSARFSNRLLIADAEQVHQPPPRSLSPAKPALKHHPKSSLSPDGRTGALSRPGQAVSEMSDGTSVGSDDGSRLGYKRKPVKVSFDDEAEIVGVAASPPTSPEDGLVESPPGKSTTKTRLFGDRKKRPQQVENFGDYEFEDVLKPRPALPSFGSIRGTREGESPMPATAELSDNESNASESSEEIVTGLPFPGGHGLGGTLHHAQSDVGQQPAELDHPTSPNANADRYTTKLKENTPARETDGGAQADSTPLSDMNAQGTPSADPFTEAGSNLGTPPSAAVPTPSGVEEGRSSLELFRVPGGFPRTSLEQDRRVSQKKTMRSSGEYSPNPTALDGAGNQKPNGHGTGDESDGSIYSDAAEDSEGGHFGSINAVVSSESPEPSKSAGFMDGDRFANLSSGRSLYTVQEVDAQQISDSPLSSQYPSVPPKSKLRTAGHMAQGQTISAAGRGGHRHGVDTNGTLQLQTGSGTIELRQEPSQGRSRRPISVSPILSTAKAADPDELEEVRGFHSPASSASSAARPISNRSDLSNMSAPAMKRTLRSGLPNLKEQSPRDVRASPGERRGQRPVSTGSTPGRMRTTLRTVNGGGNASLSSTGKAPRRGPKPERLFKQRLADSDDEDAGNGHRAFQSRFAESSDDEDPVTSSLSPVRGIPRRQGMHDGDSTELEDSSEDEGRPRRSVIARKQVSTVDNSGLAAVARSRGVTVEELQKFLLRQPQGQKGGRFHWLSMRKPKDTDGRLRKFSLDSADRWDAAQQPPVERSQAHGKPIVDGAQPPSSPKTSKRGLKKYKMTENWSPSLKPKKIGSPEPMAEPRARNQSPVYQAEPKVADSASHAGQDNTGFEAARAGKTAEADNGVFQLPETSTSALEVVIAPAGRKNRLSSLRKAFGLRS